jgi:hypothetical protein
VTSRKTLERKSLIIIILHQQITQIRTNWTRFWRRKRENLSRIELDVIIVNLKIHGSQKIAKFFDLHVENVMVSDMQKKKKECVFKTARQNRTQVFIAIGTRQSFIDTYAVL